MRKDFAIAATLSLLMMGWTNKATAQSASCTVSGVTPGRLALAQNGKNDTLSARPDQSIGAQLGTFTLTCTDGLDISIMSPTAMAGTPTTEIQGMQLWEGVPGSGVLLTEKDSAGNGTGTASLSAPITSRSLYIQMFAASPNKLLSVGTYTYHAVLTITPR